MLFNLFDVRNCKVGNQVIELGQDSPIYFQKIFELNKNLFRNFLFVKIVGVQLVDVLHQVYFKFNQLVIFYLILVEVFPVLLQIIQHFFKFKFIKKNLKFLIFLLVLLNLLFQSIVRLYQFLAFQIVQYHLVQLKLKVALSA